MISRINTKPQDIEAFQNERNIMLDEKRNFKYGSANYGLAALNSLQSMYTVFIYTEHIKQENAEEQVKELQTMIRGLRDDLILYIRTHSPIKQKEERGQRGLNLNNDNYLELINRFDDMELKIIGIKSKVGL